MDWFPTLFLNDIGIVPKSIMNLRSFLLGGTLALATNALLIVPEMMDDPAAAPGISELQTLEAHAAQQQQVELHCTECPFREEDSSAVYWVTDGSETTLVCRSRAI